MGNVDRMRRFGIRPVDFVRAAERGSAVGAPGIPPRRAAITQTAAGGSRGQRAVDYL